MTCVSVPPPAAGFYASYCLFERGHIGLAGRVPADGIFYLKWYAETIPGHGSAGFGVQELGVGRFDRIVYDTLFIRQ